MIEVPYEFIVNIILALFTTLFVVVGTWMWYDSHSRAFQIGAYLFGSIFPIIGLFTNDILVVT